ncbi:hypothetical protein ULMA_16620 [Patiriisocius marinus]|uniref:Uncharacterized protein n=1 Tax=Patiriisocius marinus TaxID=1397112 RepID=A0A5J4IX63_9FLAO|nr:hypothetical protein [Patiriisocius marinus]GER59554.1 hypothetical protein ULMA_16620 [Patiriisocius marinus]
MKKDNLKSDEKLKYNPEITERDMDILKQDNIHGDGGRDQLLKIEKQK